MAYPWPTHGQATPRPCPATVLGRSAAVHCAGLPRSLRFGPRRGLRWALRTHDMIQYRANISNTGHAANVCPLLAPSIRALPLTLTPLGAIHTLELSGINAHPFHLHVNSFQLATDPADTNGGYFKQGDTRTNRALALALSLALTLAI